MRMDFPSEKKFYRDTLLSWTSTSPLVIHDVHDDFHREQLFCEMALQSVQMIKDRLLQQNIPFSPPKDYVPLMLKSNEQMSKVQKKLMDDHSASLAKDEVKRQRLLKRMGKDIQKNILSEREDRAKRIVQEGKNHRKKVSSLISETDEFGVPHDDVDDFDVSMDDEDHVKSSRTSKSNDSRKRNTSKKMNASTGVNMKRKFKNEQYGFGGKKRFKKSNTRESTDDVSSFHVEKNRRPFAGTSKKTSQNRKNKNRPGKSKRTMIRSQRLNQKNKLSRRK